MSEQETQTAEVNRCLDAIEAWIRERHPGDLDDPELTAPIAALRAAYAMPPGAPRYPGVTVQPPGDPEADLSRLRLIGNVSFALFKAGVSQDAMRLFEDSAESCTSYENVLREARAWVTVIPAVRGADENAEDHELPRCCADYGLGHDLRLAGEYCRDEPYYGVADEGSAAYEALHELYRHTPHTSGDWPQWLASPEMETR